MADKLRKIDYKKLMGSIFQQRKDDGGRKRKSSLFEETSEVGAQKIGGPKRAESFRRHVISLFRIMRRGKTLHIRDKDAQVVSKRKTGITKRITKKALQVWEFFGGEPSEIIGLDISTSAVKAVELRYAPRGICMVDMAIEELPTDAHLVQGLVQGHIDEALKKIFSNGRFSTKKVVAGVYGSDVQMEYLSLPAGPEPELRKRVEGEAQDRLLVNLDETVIDYIGLNEAGPGAERDILLVAAQKEPVKKQLDLLRRTGLEPLAIEPVALAPLIALEEKIQKHKDSVVMLLELGSTWTYLYILIGGQLRFTRSIMLGQDAFTRAIAESYNVGFKDAERLKFKYGIAGGQGDAGKVAQALGLIQERLVNEVEQSFKHFSYNITKSTVTSIDKVLLSGGGANCKGLDKLIAERLKARTEVVSPLGNIAVDTYRIDPGVLKAVVPRLAVAIGLALRRVR